jgi:WD40 repeat protein
VYVGSNSACVWDIDSGRYELIALEGHRGRLQSVEWSADGGRALSRGDDNTLRVWDVESGRSEHVLEGHTDSVFSHGVE